MLGFKLNISNIAFIMNSYCENKKMVNVIVPHKQKLKITKDFKLLLSGCVSVFYTMSGVWKSTQKESDDERIDSTQDIFEKNILLFFGSSVFYIQRSAKTYIQLSTLEKRGLVLKLEKSQSLYPTCHSSRDGSFVAAPH